MQLVLSNNRIIAHGENFLAMGGVVINTETGAKYENATIAECDNCPSDIDKVGYEYHAGVFVPCAPFGVGNNNGFFMEVCESCATPRNSGIPIKNGLKAENMHPDFSPSQIGGMDIKLLWENASPSSNFNAQTITLAQYEWDFLIMKLSGDVTVFVREDTNEITGIVSASANNPSSGFYYFSRSLKVVKSTRKLTIGTSYYSRIGSSGFEYEGSAQLGKPLQIYGVKL